VDQLTAPASIGALREVVGLPLNVGAESIEQLGAVIEGKFDGYDFQHLGEFVGGHFHIEFLALRDRPQPFEDQATGTDIAFEHLLSKGLHHRILIGELSRGVWILLHKPVPNAGLEADVRRPAAGIPRDTLLPSVLLEVIRRSRHDSETRTRACASHFSELTSLTGTRDSRTFPLFTVFGTSFTKSVHYASTSTLTLSFQPLPEPGRLALLATGLLGFLGFSRLHSR